jgi:hypothetical protein
MKKLALIGMALGIMMMMSGPASAARIATATYGTGALGQGDVVSTCLTPAPTGPAAGLNSCVTFTIQPGETSVVVTVTDNSGQATYATVGQDYNDDGLTDSSQNFCGTSAPFAVQSSVPLGTAEIIVFPHTLPGLGDDAFAGAPAPCVGVATSGSVTADFS